VPSLSAYFLHLYLDCGLYLFNGRSAASLNFSAWGTAKKRRRLRKTAQKLLHILASIMGAVHA